MKRRAGRRLAHSSFIAGAMRRRSQSRLITGASRGIGRGIALQLARLGGYDLGINYASNEAAAVETAAACVAC